MKKSIDPAVSEYFRRLQKKSHLSRKKKYGKNLKKVMNAMRQGKKFSSVDN